jgi:FAD dependent oxidoreductase TIGR03364
MAEGCAWHEGAAASAYLGPIQPARIEGVLSSQIDVRVESRTAIPRLAAWLGAQHGVELRRGVAVHGVEAGLLETTAGTVRADTIIICPGDDLSTLFPQALAGITRCKLQMLRLADPGYRLPGAVMSDLGLVRYLGYAALAPAAALRQRLESEQAAHLANGIHLIVTQSADGSLVVGDSHHYAVTPDPFARDDVDALILDEFRAVFGHLPPVIERWTGTYASATSHSRVVSPLPGVHLVVVTSGTGASTAFALAEETLAAIAAPTKGANR